MREDKLQNQEKLEKDQSVQQPGQQKVEIQEAPQTSVDGPSAAVSRGSSNAGFMPDAANHLDGLTPETSLLAPRSSELAAEVKPESFDSRAS